MTRCSKARLGDQEVPSPVPRYMDALLLIVKSCTAIIWKSQAAESATDKPAAKEPQVRLNICPLHKTQIGTRENKEQIAMESASWFVNDLPSMQQLALGQEVLTSNNSTRRQQHSRRTQ